MVSVAQGGHNLGSQCIRQFRSYNNFSNGYLSLYEAIACGTLGTKRLLVTLVAVVSGAFLRGVTKESSLGQRRVALYGEMSI